ncbi:ATP-binding protein [Streptomyces sp. NPDC089919]|uniref:ATP-binding protein n=1 Tax=Streptomyces sp. NPDC089919 TaxID=3155188 RepID=UPI00342DC1CC
MQAIEPETVAVPPTERVRVRRRLVLRGVGRECARGRRFLKEALGDWGWDGTDTAEDALLVASELLANATLHAGGARELVLGAGEVFRVEVWDGSPEPPRMRTTARPGLPGGHGLHIVHRLADRWGVLPYADGKVVWAEIDAERLRTGAPRGR